MSHATAADRGAGGGAGTVACVRCGRQAPSLPAPPQPGPTGEEVRRKICLDCWAEWQRAEVMVINELRLNFMDPRSLEILERHMREFLLLAPASAATASGDAGASDAGDPRRSGPE